MGTKEIEDSLSGINSSLETFTNLSKQMEERLSKVSETSTDINDSFVESNKQIEKTVKQSSTLNEKFIKLRESADELTNALGVASFIGLGVAFKDSLKLEQSMKDLSARMGQGVKNGKELEKTIISIGWSTGYAMDEVTEMITGLTQFRVAREDIKDASESMLRFSKVTGLSNNESLQLYSTLNKVGGMGKNSIIRLTTEMALMQRKVGFTDGEMSSLSDSIQVSTFRMKAFGQSEVQIASMAKRTMNLAAGFVKVGLSAQSATVLIDKLTDPEQLEDNIGLYSQLGISIEDAMSGNVGDVKEKMKGFAEQVAAMGPIAGAQYAKNFGQSYNDLMKMTKMESGDIDVSAGEDASKTLSGLATEQEGTQMKLEKFINRFNAALVNFGPVILGIGVLVTSIIIPKIFKSFRKESKETNEVMRTGLIGSINMGLTKGWEKGKAQVSKIGRGISEEYKKEMVESSSFVTTHMSADFLAVQGTLKQFGIGKTVAKQAEDYTRSLAGVATPLGTAVGLTRSLRNSQKESIELSKRDLVARQEILNSSKNNLESNIKALTPRQKELEILVETLEKTNLASAAERSELKAINDEIIKFNKGLSEIGNLEEELKIDAQAIKESYKNLSEGNLEEITKELDKQIADKERELELTKKSNLELKQTEDIMTQIARDADVNLLSAQELLQDGIKNKTLNKEDYELLQKEINLNEKLISDKKIAIAAAAEGLKIQKQLEVDLSKEIDGRNEIAKLVSKTTETSNTNKGFLNVARTFTKELGSGMKMAVKDFKEKSVSTAKTFGKSLKTSASEAFKHPIKALIGTKNEETGKREGGLLKNPLAGPLAVLAFAMSILMPLLEPFFKTLKDSLMPAFKAIADALIPIMMTLVKFLLPPILKVLAFLLPPLIGLIAFLTGTKIDTKAIATGLNTAADSVSNMEISTDKNTEVTAEATAEANKKEPVLYNATGGNGFEKAVTNGATSSSSSNPKEVEKNQQVATTADSTSITAKNTDLSNTILTRINKTMEGVEKALKDIIIMNQINASKGGMNNAAVYNQGIGGPITAKAEGH